MNEIELAIATVTGAMCGDQEDVSWINDGSCYDWADQVFALLKDTEHSVEYWENPFGFADTTHAFLRIDGKFYDAECPDGVEDHMDLPIYRKLFQRTSRRQAIFIIDHNGDDKRKIVEHKRDMTDEQLAEYYKENEIEPPAFTGLAKFAVTIPLLWLLQV